MKILKLIPAVLFTIFTTASTSFAENVAGGWANVVTVHAYMVNGSFCGAGFAGMTLVKLTPESSPYGDSCEPDAALINTEAAGSDAAIAIVLSSQATGREIKIQIDNTNPLMCEANGKFYCGATQVIIK